MKRLTKFLLVCMVWFSVPAYALDSYTDDMTTTTGWVDADSGTTAAWTQEAHDGFPCFKFSIPTAGTTRYSATYRVLPVSGKNLQIKFSAWLVNVGTNANIDVMQISLTGSDATANAPFFRLCSDGFFVRKADGAFVEVGTNIVDVGDFRTDWELRVTAPTPSTARMQIWKNGVKVAENIDCSYPTTTTAYNRLTFQHAAYTLNNSLSYISNLDVKSWGLNYFAPASVVNTWTDADGGNGVSSLISGKMNFTVSSAASGSYARRAVTGISYTQKVILEARIKHNLIGTRASIDYWRFNMTPSTTTICDLRFASDGLFVRTGSATFAEVGTDIVSTGQYDTWRIWHDFSANKSWIWKNGVFVAGNVTDGYAATGLTAGFLSMEQIGFTVKGDTDVDYLRLYSEDGQLIQTIIE